MQDKAKTQEHLVDEGVHFIQKPLSTQDWALKIREVLEEKDEKKVERYSSCDNMTFKRAIRARECLA